MSLAGGKKSVSERLDSLLIKILKSMEEYVMKKEEFLNIYRDGMFDLTTSGLNKNFTSIDRFDTEADFSPLYKVTTDKDTFNIQPYKEVEPILPFSTSQKKDKEEEIRKRKEDKPSSEWIEEDTGEDAAEQAFEKKLIELKKDPLFILNPIPTKNQRSAQKTLQKSLPLLGEVCSKKRQIEKLIEEYESLAIRK